MLHERPRRPVGYIPPCLPSRAEVPPLGPDWLHEIKHDGFRCAFDLIELDGTDLRGAPLEQRKQALADLLHRERDGIALNAHYDCDGASVFKHACALGCEGIVSKRRG